MNIPVLAIRPRPPTVALVALMAAVAVALAVAELGRAGGGGGGGGGTVIGQTPRTPKPNCPTPSGDNVPADRSCQAMGRVTGFQISADGRRNPYRLRRSGRIVAWGVDVSRPTKKEQRFFAEALSKSGPPSARLSILKPKGEGRFKLVKQSPTMRLAPYLGNRPVFTLTDPLKVRKGQIVALTTATWLSNLADAGARDTDAWRASREDGQCVSEQDLLERSRPQQKVGGERNYSCAYEGARILYRAFLAS